MADISINGILFRLLMHMTKALFSNPDYLLRFCFSILAFLLLGMPLGYGKDDPASQKESNFPVFDTTNYENKPDLSKYHIKPATLIGPQILWERPADRSELPSTNHIAKIARSHNGKDKVLILDVEHWQLRGDKADVERNVEKYRRLVSEFKSNASDSLVGYYGLPIGRDYWRAISGRGSFKQKEWQTENDQLKPIASAVDASFPSLYTFYTDHSAWVNYAVANIEEARRVNPGKPVYAFIWPHYHDSNILLRGKDVPADFWRLQLTTLRQHADGIVIWGGWKECWDENAPWWKATKEFMNTLK